jgi:hypothetical protein
MIAPAGRWQIFGKGRLVWENAVHTGNIEAQRLKAEIVVALTVCLKAYPDTNPAVET